jgi:hypothetical protein
MPNPVLIKRLSPSSVSSGVLPTVGLTHQYKADSYVGVADNTALGGTGLEWVDSVGGVSYQAAQAVAALRPVFKTSVTNGLPGVLFTNLTTFATQNYLDIATGIAHVNTYSVFAVIKASTTAGQFQGGCVIGAFSVGGGVADEDTLMIIRNSVSAQSVSGLASDKGTVLAVGFIQDNFNVAFFRNNVTQSTNTLTLGTLNLNEIGAAGDMGFGPTSSVRYSGHIFEILVYDRAVSSDTRAAIQKYFGRWGI